MKYETSFEEIKNALKRIEKGNNMKTLLFVGFAIAAVFAAMVVLIIKIKESSDKKRIYNKFSDFDFDNPDDFDYDDYADADVDDDYDYDGEFADFESLEDDVDDDYTSYDLGDE
jgi:hypothetical protein